MSDIIRDILTFSWQLAAILTAIQTVRWWVKRRRRPACAICGRSRSRSIDRSIDDSTFSGRPTCGKCRQRLMHTLDVLVKAGSTDMEILRYMVDEGRETEAGMLLELIEERGGGLAMGARAGDGGRG